MAVGAESGQVKISVRAELVSIPTGTTPLDGLYYGPEGRAALVDIRDFCLAATVSPPARWHILLFLA